MRYAGLRGIQAAFIERDRALRYAAIEPTQSQSGAAGPQNSSSIASESTTATHQRRRLLSGMQAAYSVGHALNRISLETALIERNVSRAYSPLQGPGCQGIV